MGSASLLVNNSNNPVAGSRTWYLPLRQAQCRLFGGYRPGSAPTQTITDRDFTGQRENMELGLLYYNARYYVPGLGRFASADAIIPNPANPQSYNRYAYVENRPLTFRDPTGHISCTDSNLPGDDQQACQATPPVPLINFDGLEWTAEEKAVVNSGAWQVAWMLFEASGGLFSSQSEAFLAVFGGTVTFTKKDEYGPEGNLGWRKDQNTIWVYKHDQATIISEGVRWVAHELGHSFDSALHPNTTDDGGYGQGTIDLGTSDIGYTDAAGVYTQLAGGCTTRNYLTSCYQSSGDGFISRENASGTAMEDFADMFSGYVFGFANNNAGRERYGWMDSQMSVWINLAVTNNNNR